MKFLDVGRTKSGGRAESGRAGAGRCGEVCLVVDPGDYSTNLLDLTLRYQHICYNSTLVCCPFTRQSSTWKERSSSQY